MKWMLGLALLVCQGAHAQSKVDFARDVQPIFVKSCFGCHGAKMQLGGLRLDRKSAKTREILQRVTETSEQKRMPMGGKPLDAKEIAVIRSWIEQGADWPTVSADVPKHWAFVAPKRPAGKSIDEFVQARLAKEGLTPSPEADRITLLRRLSLDLTGLPPTITEVDAFLKDKSKNAYEKQVDRLLASPHYGERWGRIWLDAARYADSDGYEKDKSRQVWFYRDWIINALNRDLPYDQFVIQQIAGDMLPNATQDQIVATGFLRNSMINEEGGVDPEQFRMEAMFDRMDAIGKAVLGLTIQCAQCHDHKFDPLKQEEYYKLFAFINNSYEGSASVYTAQEQMKRADIFREIHRIAADLQHRTPDWRARMSHWEANLPKQPDWAVIHLEVDDISTGGQKYISLPDGSILAGGYAPTKHVVKLTVKPALKRLGAIRLDLLTDPNLPRGGPGRSIKGTGALTEFTATLDSKKLKFVRATADIDLPETPLEAIYDDKKPAKRVTGPVSFAIDGKSETAWGIDNGPGRRNQPRKAVFALAEPVDVPEGTVLTINLNQSHGGWNSDDNQNNNLGRFRVSITSDVNASADPLPANVRAILAVPQEKRTPAQIQAVFDYWRTTVPEWSAANARIEELWRQHPEGTSQLVMHQRDLTRETHMLQRGDFLKPGKVVEAGVPSFLNPLPEGAPCDRLTFAKWLVDRKSPTAARSMVNRLWQQYFGTGIVATSEDLGTQAEAPSHPELLDWLAVVFMDRGWSLKAMHRLIVTSATYKQSSNVTPELYSRDPYNRLLARGPRVRVEAEIVRDIALSASGLLSPKVGGPSVFPPAPEFLFKPPVSYGPKVWEESKGEDRYRRALYTFRFRSVPYPVLQNFDAPNGDFACVRRSRSNTPLQALTTLNEPLFFEAAKALGARVVKEGGSSEAGRITYAFRLCVARPPSKAEGSELQAFLERERTRLKDEDQAWTALARVLLNLDETITKE